MPAKIDEAKFDREIAQLQSGFDKLAKLHGLGVREVMWSWAPRFGNTLASSTQPKGAPAAAKVKGLRAVTRDLALAYPSPSKLFLEMRQRHGERLAAAFWEAWKLRNPNLMEKLFRSVGGTFGRMPIISAFDGGQWHRAGRDSRGRYRGRGVFCFDRGGVKRYTALVLSRVLRAKAGWVTNLHVPAGIKPKGKVNRDLAKLEAPNTITDRTRGDEIQSILFKNGTGYIGGVFQTGDAMRALRTVGRAIEKEVVKLTEKKGQKELAK